MKKKKIRTRSKFEAIVLGSLDKARISYEYEPCAITYEVPARTGRYYPDLRIKGAKWYVEIKGRFTSKDRTKHLRVKEAHPEVEVRFLFMADNKINKTSKIRYSDWAKKNGYKYHVGKEIPKEWLK